MGWGLESRELIGVQRGNTSLLSQDGRDCLELQLSQCSRNSSAISRFQVASWSNRRQPWASKVCPAGLGRAPLPQGKDHQVGLGPEVRLRGERSIFHNSAVNSRGSRQPPDSWLTRAGKKVIACLLVVPGLGLHEGWNGGSQAVCYDSLGAPGSEHFPDMRLQSSNSAIKSLSFS